jgi:lysozyme family protein
MDFAQAVAIVLEHEGGYVNHGSDPGGETNYGISKRAYPKLNIKELTKREAIDIYRNDYWNAMNCEQLPPELRLMVFDCAVNQGVGTASKILKIINLKGEMKVALKEFAEKRLTRYASLNTFPVFGAGWVRRLISILIYSL